MFAGIAFQKIDALRPMLEDRGCIQLTSSTHLKPFIPMIEDYELRTLRCEIEGQRVAVIFDGTTRLGECVAVLLRWCSADFKGVQQRLVALQTMRRHMDGDELGAMLMMLLLNGMKVKPADVVCVARDSCSTNGKAHRNIAPVLLNAESILCISHTLSHCCEHVDLPTLDSFMTPWLSLVQHHPTARSRWSEKIGCAMKGFSTIRWCSRDEVANEIAKNFGALEGYLADLVADEIGDKHPKKMKHVLDTQRKTLQLELACSLDLEPIISACISLEGDGLTILLARTKLDELLAFGDTLGDRATSLPNVSALLRQHTELKAGVQVYEYFADVNPPRWYKGSITSVANNGTCKVKYEDNSIIEQEEREVRQWIDVRDMAEWKRLAAAARCGITYLRNRLTDNLPPGQINYCCGHMYEVLRVLQVFDPSWASDHLSPEIVDGLACVKPLAALVPQLQTELHKYKVAVQGVHIDHTETKEDHTFTTQVLSWWSRSASKVPAWAQAARIVFAFTPNSASAERVFSLLKCMFGDLQETALADYVQTAVMLRYNKREVG